MDAEDPGAPRSRPSISERAARRDRLERPGSDRYSSLLHALYGGREVSWQRGRARSAGWHPIAWTLLRVAIVVVIAYVGLRFGLDALRQARIDTWSGPDAAVTSGERLDGCAAVGTVRSDTFPAWVRFDGSVYRLTEAIRPVGSSPTPDYPVTGYELGSLRLNRIANTPDGQSGDVILVKIDTQQVGAVYARVPECP